MKSGRNKREHAKPPLCFEKVIQTGSEAAMRVFRDSTKVLWQNQRERRLLFFPKEGKQVCGFLVCFGLVSEKVLNWKHLDSNLCGICKLEYHILA